MLLNHIRDAAASINSNHLITMNNLSHLAQNYSPVSCMVWNVQGTGDRAFLAVLKEIIRTHQPNVLALVETHMGGDHAVRMASILGYNGHVRVDAQGFSGGIWVYWNKNIVTVEPIRQHEQYIIMEIARVGEIPWYFTAVYASPNPSKRQELWRDLKTFAATHNKPWMIAGDFNETRYRWERSSSCGDTDRRSRRFNDWVEELELVEVEFVGAAHTWARASQ
ncbi:putative RNA-directed DNA polymerase from transposon X-element [Bienertia sinuspersici]